MFNRLSACWERRVAHWNKGGGYVAAGLWWLVFVLLTFGFAVNKPFWLDTGKKRTPWLNSYSNLRNIGTALSMYVQEYDERLPPMQNVAAMRRATDRYLSRRLGGGSDRLEQTWRTPQTDALYAVNASLSRQPLGKYLRPYEIVAVWDTRLWRGSSIIVCQPDGHVKSVKVADWPRIRAHSGIVNEPSFTFGPPWWVAHTAEERVSVLLRGLLLIAAGLALCAAGREAWFWVGKRRPFVLCFACWLLVRWLGYGACVLLLALATGLVAGPPPEPLPY